MSTREPRPALKSITGTPDGPRPATPAPAPDGRSAPEGRRPKGVPSDLLPDPHPATDDRRIVGGLHISAPRGAVPTATSWCSCGRDRMAAGHRRVADLIADHTRHRAVCPLLTQEGEAA